MVGWLIAGVSVAGATLLVVLALIKLRVAFAHSSSPSSLASRRRSGREPLRVAFIHPDLGIGGAERLVVDAGVGLQQRGHYVRFYTSHHDPDHCFAETKTRKRHMVNDQLEVTVYGDFLPRALFGRCKLLCTIIRNLYVVMRISLAANEQFDILFVDQLSFSIPLLKFLLKSKILFYCHHPDLLLTTRTSLLKRIYRFAFDLSEEITTGMSDKILVNSGYTLKVFKQTFTHLRVEPKILYPAINFANYDRKLADTVADDKKSDEETEDEHLFVSLNRYERKKNIGLAIQAFALLKTLRPKEYAKCRLVVAGGYDPQLAENVEHFEELKKIAQQSNITDNQISFLRSISDTKRNSLLRQCLCVLYTPENEHFGIVPIECMYAQRPVVACNSGGPVESVEHERTGYLCEPTPKAFADAMVELLDDKKRASEMGKYARQRVVDRFGLLSFTDSLEDTLYSMV